MSLNKVILITGSNTGLGYAIIQSLLQSTSGGPYTILMGTRSIDKGNKALADLKADKDCAEGFNKGSEVVVVQCDLGDENGFERIVQDIGNKYGRLDALVNNAGINRDFELHDGKCTLREAFIDAFNTNVVNTHIFTESLIPLLFKSSSPRLIFITSGVGSLTSQLKGDSGLMDKSPESGWPKKWQPNIITYRTSKAAENMLALEWRRILGNDNVKVSVIDPGLLATNLAGFTPEQSKEQMNAADPIIGGNLVRATLGGERDGDDGKLLKTGGTWDW